MQRRDPQMARPLRLGSSSQAALNLFLQGVRRAPTRSEEMTVGGRRCVQSLRDHLDPAIRDHLKTGHSKIRVIWVEPGTLPADARAATGAQEVSRASELRSSLARPWTPPAPRRPSANIASRREPGRADHAARNLSNHMAGSEVITYGRIQGDH